MFGESVLNDSVAIVLYRSLLRFVTVTVTGTEVILAIVQFIYIFLGSLAIGLLVAAILAWVCYPGSCFCIPAPG